MIYFLCISALFTSVISAVIGMGGGILLLSIMTFFLPIELIIPIHGIVQLVSNFSRVYYLKHFINKKFLIYFVLGTPIGFITAFNILSSIKVNNVYYLMLALFILYTVFKPKSLPSPRLKTWGWSILGFVSVIQGAILGATGPLIAPFYIRDDLNKKEIIATKASQQIFIHFLKIPLFLTLEFSYEENIKLILGLSVCAVAGSYVGTKKILTKINERNFKRFFKVVLSVSALRLLYKYFI